MNLKHYQKQVRLLLDVLPFIDKEACFALKGGTAINLFVRDLPRLSVDIDLAYVGDEPRAEALKLTAAALKRIKADIKTGISGTKVIGSKPSTQAEEAKLFIDLDGAQVKIEANPVIRGTLFPSKRLTLQPKAVEVFEVELDFNIVDLPDLYGEKLTAALDRQHPRDLFDVSLLLENEGLNRKIIMGFVCYLLSHRRPIHEILSPTPKNQRALLNTEFDGMTDVPFDYEDFERTRDAMIKGLHNGLSTNDRRFLISFASGTPDWSLFGEPKIATLPAVLWKLKNIGNMTQPKRDQMVASLNALFS